MVAAVKTPSILPCIAGGVLLFQELTSRRGHAILHKLVAVLSANFTKAPSQTRITYAGDGANTGESQFHRAMAMMIREALGNPHSCDEIDGHIWEWIEGIVIFWDARQASSHDHGSDTANHRVWEESYASMQLNARTVLSFTTTRADLSLCHSICIHHQCVWAICHCWCVEASAKPDVGRTRHGDLGISALQAFFT